MKLAVVGKGGAGKTSLSALLARALAERGLMVLAVDLDSNPGLAISLGIHSHDAPLPDEAVEARAGTPFGWDLAEHLTAAEAVRRFAIPADEQIFFLGFGNSAEIDSPLVRYLTAVRHIVEDFDEPDWVVVADLAAGPTNTFEGYARFASLALIAAEPTRASILTAKGLRDILAQDKTPAEVVLTKVRSPDDVARAGGDVEPFASVPFDPEVARLEEHGSLAGLSEHSCALEAVRSLVAKLVP